MYRSPRSLDVRSTLIGALGCTVLFVTLGADRLGGRGTSVSTISMLTREQAEILSHMSIVHLDDGQGGTAKTIRVTGVNVQIVNGLGATNGLPPTPDAAGVANGVGNLIVGYNEPGNPDGDDRTGSHNVVVGHGNTYSGYGGLVVAQDNSITSFYSVACGGIRNHASAPHSSVLGGAGNSASCGAATSVGGTGNTASGSVSSTFGGGNNVASGRRSWMGGGTYNVAPGENSSVLGGHMNTAMNLYDVVLGGQFNTAAGTWSTVTGGRFNTASGDNSVVGGGNARDAMSTDDWAAGSLYENN